MPLLRRGPRSIRGRVRYLWNRGWGPSAVDSASGRKSKDAREDTRDTKGTRRFLERDGAVPGLFLGRGGCKPRLAPFSPVLTLRFLFRVSKERPLAPLIATLQFAQPPRAFAVPLGRSPVGEVKPRLGLGETIISGPRARSRGSKRLAVSRDCVVHPPCRAYALISPPLLSSTRLRVRLSCHFPEHAPIPRKIPRGALFATRSARKSLAA